MKKNAILQDAEGRNPSRKHEVPKKKEKSAGSDWGSRQDQEIRGKLDFGQRRGSRCFLVSPTVRPHCGGSSAGPQMWSICGGGRSVRGVTSPLPAASKGAGPWAIETKL